MKMRTILVSALLLLSAAFLVCRLLKKNRISIFIYQVGLVIIAFTALLTDNVLLTCCIPAGLDHFDAPLVVAILNQIQGHLNAVYPTIMEKLWKK